MNVFTLNASFLEKYLHNLSFCRNFAGEKFGT